MSKATFGPLYKKDSKGKIRFWKVNVEGDRYQTESGLVDGSPVAPEWTTAKPKNVGRANETSGEAQALLEAQALYDKKLKEDYHVDVADVDTKSMLEPMLAKKYEDYPVVFPAYCQPKLDGFRANTKVDGLYSRRNEKYFNVSHIEFVLNIADIEGVIFDGELYNHDLAEDFDQLQSLVMKKKPTIADRDAASKVIQYHIYDIMDPKKTFEERQQTLSAIFMKYPSMAQVCKHVPTYKVLHQQALDELYELFLKEGYEGQMVRTNALYENKRSKSLLKRKEFEDHEYQIVEIQEGLGNRSGMAGAVLCRLPDGRTFGAGIKGGVAVNGDLWKKRTELVERWATITHFKQLTPDGIPRFPVFKSVREDI